MEKLRGELEGVKGDFARAHAELREAEAAHRRAVQAKEGEVRVCVCGGRGGDVLPTVR